MNNSQLWALTAKIAAAPRPAIYAYMGDEEWYDATRQMIEDLARLARDDGCIAAAWSLAVLGLYDEVPE